MQWNEVRAIVTGGARGMGFRFVQGVREAGGRVAFCDVDPSTVAAAAIELDAIGIPADVSREEDVARLFDVAEEALGGPVNVLVNNAGITRDGLLVRADKETGEIKVMSKANWDAVLAVNLTGPFLCMRELASRAVKAKLPEAVAVNLSSISRAGNPGQGNYSAAKAGLAADTAVWAKELGRYGIRVGAVAPGFIRTPMTEAMRPDVLEKILLPVPLRRMGEPEDVWLAVKFIVECRYFSGRVVEVDGGLTL